MQDQFGFAYRERSGSRQKLGLSIATVSIVDPAQNVYIIPWVTGSIRLLRPTGFN